MSASDPPAKATAAFTLLSIVIVVLEAAVPFGVTDVGLNAQVEFVGRPEHAKVVAAANPFTGVTVIVAVAAVPAVTDAVAGEIERLKSAAGGAFTVIDTADELEVRLPASPPYAAVTEWLPTVRAEVM